MGSYVFLIFAGCIALLITYIFFTLPETKGKTIEEISAVFMKAKPQMNGVGEYDNEGFTHYDSQTAELGTKRRLSMQKSVSQETLRDSNMLEVHDDPSHAAPCTPEPHHHLYGAVPDETTQM
ncbi:PREDICTED: solute carrier family 2, facilitated glucose transporter member 7-like [Priapulus caudatus]|uniref:Solute carrier family 2, facilitated glucose transporter member 7-like n=1 Tax=Priapulus caudatus TaxID=37621 RepID=A0ABM1E9S6_PRICU|nr:PREDICTED: solute carrier family 2, facilitated glucose transporter member 7-like [Priapulus caudatus]